MLPCRSSQIFQKPTSFEDGWWTSLVRAPVLIHRYDAEGRNSEFTAYSNQTVQRSDNNAPIRPNELKTLGQAKDEQLGMGDKTDYFTSSATVSFIKQDSFAYPACANPDGCNKKVVDDGNGWMCEKCDKKWPEPIWR
jgi:replication factor A1